MIDAGARERALGNIANNVSASASDARLQRFARRQRSSEWLIGDAREAAGLPRDSRDDESKQWVRPLRPARCRWRASLSVGVHCDHEAAYAHYSGLERCASIWSCPVCSAIIRAGRSVDIKAAAESANEKGLSVVFATMTQRHQMGDALAFTLDVMLTGFRKLQASRAYKKLAERYSLVGMIRATEITYGKNGWHPHNHLLYFFESKMNAHDVARFEHEFGALWISKCAALGAGVPTQEHGVDCKLVEKGGTVLAEYITKFQEPGEYRERKTSIGLEIARGDLKTGKLDSLVPFQLLDAAGHGSETARTLWLEYVHATRGRRAFSWSKGLRELLLPDTEEMTDEEIIEDAERAELVLVLESDFYDRVLKENPSNLAGALELAELGLAAHIVEELSNDPPPPKPRPSFT